MQTVIRRAFIVPDVRQPDSAQTPSVRKNVRKAVSATTSDFLERVATELRREIATIDSRAPAHLRRAVKYEPRYQVHAESSPL
jgi:hypothetical protein